MERDFRFKQIAKAKSLFQSDWQKAKDILLDLLKKDERDLLAINMLKQLAEFLGESSRTLLENAEKLEQRAHELEEIECKRRQKEEMRLLEAYSFIEIGDLDQAARIFIEILTEDRANATAISGLKDLERRTTSNLKLHQYIARKLIEFGLADDLIKQRLEETELKIRKQSFETGIRKAESYLEKGLIGEFRQHFEEIKTYADTKEEKTRLQNIEHEARKVQNDRLKRIERFRNLLNQIQERISKEQCPLCGKELGGATRCWNRSCEPHWDIIALCSTDEKIVTEISNQEFEEVVSLLERLNKTDNA